MIDLGVCLIPDAADALRQLELTARINLRL
jgi:hypothetical protein